MRARLRDRVLSAQPINAGPRVRNFVAFGKAALARFGLSGLLHQFKALHRRLKLLTRLMPLSSAGMLVARRNAPVVRIFLKATSTYCQLRPRSSDLDCLRQTFVNMQYLLPFDLIPQVIVDGGA